MNPDMLKCYSVFKSIQGEFTAAMPAGSVSYFLRLYGCNLNCVWCDTKMEKDLFSHFEVTSLSKAFNYSPVKNVVITGGEPLLQVDGVTALVKDLVEKKNVVIETNGSIVIPEKLEFINRQRLAFAVDYKLSSSGKLPPDYNNNFFENLKKLRKSDTVRFVVSSHKDYMEAKEVYYECKSRRLVDGPIYSFSPVLDKFDPGRLVKLMVLEDVRFVFSLQLHKILDLLEDQNPSFKF